VKRSGHNDKRDWANQFHKQFCQPSQFSKYKKSETSVLLRILMPGKQQLPKECCIMPGPCHRPETLMKGRQPWII
jgi:hypothetical protein